MMAALWLRARLHWSYNTCRSYPQPPSLGPGQPKSFSPLSQILLLPAWPLLVKESNQTPWHATYSLKLEEVVRCLVAL